MAPKGNKIAMPLPAGPLPVGLVRPQAAASSAAASSSVPMMQPPPVGVATPMGVVPPPPPPWPKATSEQWLSKSETVETADLKRLKIGEDDATAVWPKVHCKDSLTDGDDDDNCCICSIGCSVSSVASITSARTVMASTSGPR